MYAVWSFNFKADDKAVPYAITYGLKNIKSVKKIPDAGYLSVEYLARFASKHEDAKKIFARINKNFDDLPPTEKDVFEGQFPEIFKRL